MSRSVKSHSKDQGGQGPRIPQLWCSWAASHLGTHPPSPACPPSPLRSTDGPYLRRLRHLSLRGNALPALPPALANAAELETLDCGENLG